VLSHRFHNEAYRFLEAMATAQGRKDAGIDMMSFGKQAFTYKDKKNNEQIKPWAEGTVNDFKEALRAKLK
jgi:hypothetical protein